MPILFILSRWGLRAFVKMQMLPERSYTLSSQYNWVSYMKYFINFHDWVGPVGMEHKTDKFSFRKTNQEQKQHQDAKVKNLFLPLLPSSLHPNPLTSFLMGSLWGRRYKNKGYRTWKERLPKANLCLYYIRLPMTTSLYGNTLFTL